MGNKVKVLYKEVGKEPTILEIEDTYEIKKSLVGGYVEYCYFDIIKKNVGMIVNEEGKLENLPINFKSKTYNEIFVGNVVFIRENENGLTDITEEDIEDITKWLENESKTVENAFTKWLDTFLEEKGIDLDTFINIQSENKISMVQYANIVEFIKNNTSKETQEVIKNTLVKIDFANASVEKYLQWLGEKIYS